MRSEMGASSARISSYMGISSVPPRPNAGSVVRHGREVWMRSLVMVLLLAGCWSTEDRIAQVEEKVKDEMVVHHKEVLAARDAVIAGDHANATSALGALAERLPLEGLDRGRQQPLIDVVRAGAKADDLDAVARAVGKAGAACGTCHKAVGATPPTEAGPKPKAGSDVPSQMRLHHWALLTMWDGLVRGDDGAFASAAQALNATPMIPSGTPVDAPVPPEAAQLEIRVHDMAAKAARAGDPLERGKAVGKMLGTCQQCHLLMDGGPAKSE